MEENHHRNEKTAALSPPKVLFFDVNESLLNLSILKASVGKALGGREDLVPLWFTTMLQYSLVTTTSGQFADFGTIGAATLSMVAANNKINLTKSEAEYAISPILRLSPHPEVKQALANARNAGFTMASLTNSSKKGVEEQFNNAGLTEFFDERLSVEEVRKYKPHREVYHWAAEKLKARPEECMMIAAHGWDVAGAMWAGWRAAFIARPGQQLYPMSPPPEINEPNLLKVIEKLMELKR